VVTSQATKKVVPIGADDEQNLSYTDYIAAKRRKRMASLSARRANRKEQRALMQQLHRRLTHVSWTYALCPTVTFVYLNLQAERTTLALQRNHPELANVWIDLEKNSSKGKPQNATQPANLKVTLLPFQLEGLFWMRKQEKGVWHGGILAVRLHLVLSFRVWLYWIQDEMGYVILPSYVLALTFAEWGRLSRPFPYSFLMSEGQI
jgi:DNA repair protein RAD16